MSYSALYKIYNTTASNFAEFRNGHGSAPPVWEWVARTYCGMPKDTYIFAGQWMKAIFREQTLIDLPENWRRVLLFTADFAVCPDDYRITLAGHCRSVWAHLEEWEEWGPSRVNHWSAIADELEAVKLTKRCLGVGLSCTSVADIWGEYSRSKGEYGGPKRFFVNEAIGSQGGAA